MRIQGSNCSILKLPCCRSTFKKLLLLIPWELRGYNIQTSKFLFFKVFFTVNLFTSKLMKIRWSFLFFGSFAPHFQIKLSTHGSNLNSMFVIMSELEFLEKNSKTTHLDRNNHIEVNIMQNHEQKKKWKKVKNQDFMGKKNFFLSTLPLSPWAVSATW
jgi:hypothetical protein